jgi:hypothetical protein
MVFRDSNWLILGFFIVEVFVWGIFWSTICRTQSPAVLGGFASPVCAIWIFFIGCHCFYGHIPHVETELMLYRFIVTGIVAVLALWRAMRWFAQEKKSFFLSKIELRNAMLFRYPKHVQTPFFALVHQHLRHASLLYSFGILCFIVFGCGGLVLCFLDDATQIHLFETWWWTIGAAACFITPFVFWGSIFSHDQHNDSYKLLSRIGVYEGTVWWSRMLPPMPFYLFGGLCVVVHFFVSASAQGVWNNAVMWEQFKLFAPIALIVWLSLPALGALGSISFRSQLAAIALTFLGMYLFIMWAFLGIMWFGCNPLGTTLPIVLAVLLVSRIRAGYWLREKLNWRIRLYTLYPVFGIFLTILIALPFVRIYSVPNVSLQQIESSFAQANRQETYEEFLAIHYNPEAVTDEWFKQRVQDRDSLTGLLFCSPWETARRDRMLRVRMVALLDWQHAGGDECSKFMEKLSHRHEVIFDLWIEMFDVPLDGRLPKGRQSPHKR